MLDILIVLAFVAYAVSSGFYSRKKASRNLKEYFLAGRTLPGWKAGFSMSATQFAADTPLLVMGLIATGGIFLVWRLWIYGIAFLMMGFIFSAAWRDAGVLTDAELTEVRYSGRGVLPLRVLKAVYYGTVINCVVMAMVLVAAVRIAEVFLPWHTWLPPGVYNPILEAVRWSGISLGTSVTGLSNDMATANNILSILAMMSFTTLYSMTGGLRSVVATDVMQFSIAMVGTLVYGIYVVYNAGGIQTMIQKVVGIYGPGLSSKLLSFGPSVGEALMPFLILIGLQWFFQMNSDGTGYLAQRSMACRTDRQARIAAVLFAWMQIFARSLIWIVIGVGLLVIYPFTASQAAGDQFVAHREMLFVNGINDMLPIGIRGLMLTALLAALASTVDTHLNWGASYWSNDIYKRLVCERWWRRQPKNRELVIMARLSNLLILAIALIIMANLGSIQKAWYVSLLFGAGMGSVLVMRWLWERINLYSELAAMATSLIAAPIILFRTQTEEWERLAIMAALSTAAAIAVTFFTPRTKNEVLRSFYAKVRPMGFWRRTAKLVGEEPSKPVKKLARGVNTTLFASASLFLFLIGCGKLLIHMPGEPVIWAWLCIALAIIISPMWLKHLSRGKETAQAEHAPDLGSLLG